MVVGLNSFIVIPVYQPRSNLIGLVDEIIHLQSQSKKAPSTIIVINDGSTNPFAKEIFHKLEAREFVDVVHHDVNLGKGAALKTGIEYALSYDADFVVTADADGQHLPVDIVRIVDNFDEAKLVLGVRNFDDNVPFRSRFGNVLTRALFRLLYRSKISDTQSGLRCIPSRFFEDILKSTATGYEFELEMLIYASKKQSIIEVPIQTVYEPGNPTSHFNPIFDSLRIYFLLLRGILSSLFVTTVDVVIFATCTFVGLSTFYAIAVARSVATLIYFILGKKFVFRSDGPYILEFFKFISLVIVNVAILTPFINYASDTLEFNKTASYAVGSSLLFFFNFFIQKLVVFR